MKKLTRSYILQIDPNFHKMEEVRYNAQIYIKYLQHFVTQLYFSQKKFFSTKGMGTLANQAQKQAMGILNSHRKAIKETGDKSNIPQIKFKLTPALISKSKDTKYDYWVDILSQFKNKVLIPAKSHKCLNKSLKDGWVLSKYCEITEKNKKWFCRVFVTKEKPKPIIKQKSLGIDVGIKHGTTRSDNYLGYNLSKIIKEEKEKQRSRNKNKHKKKIQIKSRIKMVLDREVNRAIGRSKKLGLNLAVENPKRLTNLSSGKLQGWARSYFGNRLQVKAREEGIWVSKVNPAYTSITCFKCKKIDKKSRQSQSLFKCTTCGNTVNADRNAAFNVALKGQDWATKVANKTPVRST